MLPTIQVLVEDFLYVSQGDIPTTGGDAEYGGRAVPGARSKVAVRRPRGSSVYLQKIPLQGYKTQRTAVPSSWQA